MPVKETRKTPNQPAPTPVVTGPPAPPPPPPTSLPTSALDLKREMKTEVKTESVFTPSTQPMQVKKELFDTLFTSSIKTTPVTSLTSLTSIKPEVGSVKQEALLTCKSEVVEEPLIHRDTSLVHPSEGFLEPQLDDSLEDIKSPAEADISSDQIEVGVQPKLKVNVTPKLEVNSQPTVDVNVQPTVEVNVQPKLEVNDPPKMEVSVQPKVEVTVQPKLEDLPPTVEVNTKPKLEVVPPSIPHHSPSSVKTESLSESVSDRIPRESISVSASQKSVNDQTPKKLVCDPTPQESVRDSVESIADKPLTPVKPDPVKLEEDSDAKLCAETLILFAETDMPVPTDLTHDLDVKRELMGSDMTVAKGESGFDLSGFGVLCAGIEKLEQLPVTPGLDLLTFITRYHR